MKTAEPVALAFILVAANKRVIADSAEGYCNKPDCLHSISLMNSAPVTSSKSGRFVNAGSTAPRH